MTTEQDLNKAGSKAVATVETPAAVETAAAPKSVAAAVSQAKEILEHSVTEHTHAELKKADATVSDSTIALIVEKAVSASMNSIVPVLERLVAPTPLEAEQMETLAKQRERFAREKKIMMQQEGENRKNLAAKQANCSHLDANSKEAIALSRNFPDRQARGICMRCNLTITPKEYRCPLPPVTMEQALKYIQHVERSEGIFGVTPYEDPKTCRIEDGKPVHGTGLVTHFLYPEHRLYHRVRELLSREQQALAS
ncbi:MAG TPA: hypothetical protein VMF66_07165 [Candidatus Acidoferrum sp.]|nr:hypothetical protein [Candidatus Acidoferrum sp.]